MRWWGAKLAALLLATACQGTDPGTADPAGDAGVSADEGGAPDTTAAPACRAGSRWSPGTDAFVEATASWGLTGVVGIRMSVTDFDGDGWADLFVRLGSGPDDFSEGGARGRWLLRNNQQGGFEDATQDSGLLSGRYNPDEDFGREAEVCASGDVNNDGALDIFLARSQNETTLGLETSEVMLGSGQGTFYFGASDNPVRFEGEVTVPVGASFIDYDLDGNLDLWFTQNMAGGQTMPLQDRLFRGDGTGRFTEVTIAAGVETVDWIDVTELNDALGHSWAWSSAACDLNGDGFPELLAASYGRVPNHLWRAVPSDDGVTFVNESIASGYAYDHREDWTDNVSAQCHCFDHPDDDECDIVPAPPAAIDCQLLKDSFGGSYRWSHGSDREAWRLGGNSAATTCVDIDNDGDLDLLTGEIVHWDVGSSSDPAELLINLDDPEVRFWRPGNDETGLVRTHSSSYWDNGDMTNAVLDFDNDGWTDVYIGASDYWENEGLLFHQEAPLEFTRLETSEFFDHNRSHGVATADFDRDGDIDMVVGHSQMRCDGDFGLDCYDSPQIRFFENTMGDTSNWLQVRLEGGPGTNRSAIGARVSVSADGVTQTQYVDGGHGHFNTQRDMVLHFGLGEACDAAVEIVWPNAAQTTQTFSVPANQRYQVLQGSEPVADPI